MEALNSKPCIVQFTAYDTEYTCIPYVKKFNDEEIHYIAKGLDFVFSIIKAYDHWEYGVRFDWEEDM